MTTPLSQQHHQVVKPLSHRDPSIIMQSSLIRLIQSGLLIKNIYKTYDLILA